MKVFSTLVLFLLLAACQALEPADADVENTIPSTANPNAALLASTPATVTTPTPTSAPTKLTPVMPSPTFPRPSPAWPTPTPAQPTPIPAEAPALDYSCPLDLAIISSDPRTPGVSVGVAFIAENGIQLWDEASNTRELLFESGDVTSLAFSDDQQLIAFTRQNEQYQTSLWILDVGERGARELLSAADLLALNLSETKDLAVDPYRLVWIPGTHRLAFSTRTAATGDAPPDVFQEMRVIDADSRELVELLDHSQGGTFTFSPDGAFFALVSDTSVSLFRTNGERVAKDLVIYPALGMADFYYHPPVSWNADSQFFTFAMINTTDGLEVAYNPDVTSTIYQVGAAGWVSEQGTITGMTLDHAFSPDLQHVAFMRTSPKGPPLRELHIAAVNNEWDVVYREGESLSFGQWNPDAESRQFIFYEGWAEPAIGRLCGVAEPLPSAAGPGSTRRVNWVDAARYLYASHPAGEFYLGSVDGSPKLIGRMDPERISGRTGPLKDYDFYWPSSAAAGSGTELSTAVHSLPAANSPEKIAARDLPPIDNQAAQDTLIRYFALLSEGEYAVAVELHGAGYEALKEWNPTIEPDDFAGLLENGCTANGLICLPVKSITSMGISAPNTFKFAVQFEKPDGSLFTLNPEGDWLEHDLPRSSFIYTVMQTEDGFTVQELPVSTP